MNYPAPVRKPPVLRPATLFILIAPNRTNHA